MTRPGVRLSCLCVLVTLVAGCGVQTEDQAHPAAVSFTDESQTPEPSVTGSASANAQIFLVKDQELQGVRRHLPPPITVTAVLDAIAAGPTEDERGKGLRTALLAPFTVTRVVVDRDGAATLVLESEPTQSGAAELVLAFGQVVISVSSLPGIHSLRFTVGDEPLSIPRGDGSLTDAAVTSDDYSVLRK